VQPGEIKLASLYLECTLEGYLKYYIDFWLTRNRVCDSTGRWIRGQVLEQGVERNYWNGTRRMANCGDKIYDIYSSTV
jgi:hypothetical protein